MSFENVLRRAQESQERATAELREKVLAHKPRTMECEICKKPRTEQLIPDWEILLTSHILPFASPLSFYAPESHPACDALRTQNERSKAKQALIDQHFQSVLKLGIPTDFRSKTLATFQATNADLEKAVKLVSVWNPSDESGFLFMGPSGSGKSHLLLSVLNRVVTEFAEQEFEEKEKNKNNLDLHYISGRRRTVYATAAQFFAKVRSEMDWRFEDVITNYLFLDDLGAENTTDWGREVLFRLFDHCVSNKVTVFITTNLTMNEMREKLHERIVSRIMHLCIPMAIQAPDKRKEFMLKKAEEIKRRAGLT